MKTDDKLPLVCEFCSDKIMPLETRYLIGKAVKPKHTPFRFKHIGYACEPCGDNKDNQIWIDDYE